MIKIRITYEDNSIDDIEIESKFMPIINDVISRIQKLTRSGTMVYATEKEIYEV